MEDEIEPQFRIATPEGDFWIALTLPEDVSERARRMRIGSDFMALKCCPAFVLVTEIKELDALIAIGVSYNLLRRADVHARHHRLCPFAGAAFRATAQIRRLTVRAPLERPLERWVNAALGHPITGAATGGRKPLPLAGDSVEPPRTTRKLIATPHIYGDRTAAGDAADDRD
jgi:hypothetical protein